jgi:hypothetical protein
VTGCRRIQHGDWFVQSTQGVTAWIAWASRDRLNHVLEPSTGDVYFQFGSTEAQAVERVIEEIDALPAAGQAPGRFCGNGDPDCTRLHLAGDPKPDPPGQI